ncbi:MAG: RNA polymerase sigma factor [Verrucomicrobiota bacterium]
MSSANPPAESLPPANPAPLGQWLEAYVGGDQQAFSNLVHQTTPVVMAAALRRCDGRYALAQEAAQAVFVDLARRAPSLRADATLTGWLHQRATRAAGDLMKQELRRIAREQPAAVAEACYSLNDDPVSSAWMDCREQVDEALSRLKLEERTAVLLRCAEGTGFEAVGKALGCSTEAARKKVSRALEKLRATLGRHRTGISAVVIMKGLAADQANAAAGAAGGGINLLANELARNALTGVGPMTVMAKALPWLKAMGTGAAAAAAVWAWPVAVRLWQSPPAVPVPAPEPALAAVAAGQKFPPVPVREPLKDGLSLDEIVRRLAALVEGPQYPHDWSTVNFYATQITPGRTGQALTKLKQLVSPRAWHEFLKRSWAEDFFKTWAALEGTAALDFLMSHLEEREFLEAAGPGAGWASPISNLVWRCIESTCGLGNRTDTKVVNAGENARLLMDWSTALLTPSDNGSRMAKQEMLISRGTELASNVVGTGDPAAIRQLIDLVNQHGFKWLDSSVSWIKSKEILTTMMEMLAHLDSPEQRTVLQIAVLRKMAEMDLPAAMKQVEGTRDPAQRWKFAEAVGAPAYRLKMGKDLIVDELAKQKVDWWLRQAIPGQEEEAAQTILGSWLRMDPEWALDWMDRTISPEAALVPLKESLRTAVGTISTFGAEHHKDVPNQLLKYAALLQRRNPALAISYIDQLLERNARGKHIEAVRKLLKP